MTLDFDHFREQNDLRAEHPKFAQCLAWDHSKWLQAITGEIGELANELKKWDRGDYDNIPEETRNKIFAMEAADVVTYVDRFCSYMGIDLGEAVRQKFNDVSQRIGSDITIEPVINITNPLETMARDIHQMSRMVNDALGELTLLVDTEEDTNFADTESDMTHAIDLSIKKEHHTRDQSVTQPHGKIKVTGVDLGEETITVKAESLTPHRPRGEKDSSKTPMLDRLRQLLENPNLDAVSMVWYRAGSSQPESNIFKRHQMRFLSNREVEVILSDHIFGNRAIIALANGQIELVEPIIIKPLDLNHGDKVYTPEGYGTYLHELANGRKAVRMISTRQEHHFLPHEVLLVEHSTDTTV